MVHKNAFPGLFKLVRASLIIIPFLIGVVYISYGQAEKWSQPEALSDEFQSSWFPDIAADPTGRIHVVWSVGVTVATREAYDVVMYTTSQNGVDWSALKDIVALPSKGAVTRPTLNVDSNGFLNLTYRDYTLYYTRMPVWSVTPKSFLAPQIISTPENGYFSRMVGDKDRRLHLVYTENVHDARCTGCFHVMYRQSGDQGLTWTNPVDLTTQPNGAAKPQILVDDQNIIHVAWEAGAGGDLGQIPDPTTVMYANSTDLGQTWSAPLEFTTPGKGARNIALGGNGSNQLIVAYLGLPENIVYYRVSNDRGKNWSAYKPVPGIIGAWTIYQGKTDDYSMATDSAGNVHFVLVGQLANERFQPKIQLETPSPTITTTIPGLVFTPEPIKLPLYVLQLTWNGRDWSQPEEVDELRGDVPEWPRIAVGNGNLLHLVWFVRDERHIFGGEGNFRYRIWYAQKYASAPRYTPAAWNTLATTSEPQVNTTVTPEAAILTPSAMPSPTRPTFVQNVGNPPIVDSESGYLKIVAYSLIPASLFVLLVILISRLRLRR